MAADWRLFSSYRLVHGDHNKERYERRIGRATVPSRVRGYSSWTGGLIERIRDCCAIELLRPRIAQAASRIAHGEVVLLPGQGVYVFLLDGYNLQAVERLRATKGRGPNQREATVVHPERLFQLVDFALLKELNPANNRDVVVALYQAHPVGSVLPCREDAVPQHLITYHEIKGRTIPTIMNIWLSRYRIFTLLWREISCYPEVLLAGSSANRTGDASPVVFREAYLNLFSHPPAAIRDPAGGKHFYQGSHTMLDLTRDPAAVDRTGSVDPNRHPRHFKDWKDILPQLVLA